MTSARASLDAMVAVDSTLARQQERFFQYLPGYIGLYTGQTALAVREMERATAIPGNDRDPQLRYLLGLSCEQAGQADRAKAQYQQWLEMASGNNPPNSFARREAAKKRWM
jgi:Flp pilus assembly protein TadD